MRLIRKYSHVNLKNTSCEHEVGPVTLFTGPHRSGKTARMLGIALAATGKCELGARRDKLQPLVSKDCNYACATLGDGANTVYADWVCDSRGCATSAEPGMFGTLLTAKAFWDLTGEEKWKVINSLVKPPSEFTARLLNFPFSQGQGEDIALAENIQQSIDNEIKSLKANLENLSASLQPPEPYTGEPLAELNTKRREIENLIADQKKSREYWDKRPDFDRLIEEKAAESQKKADEYNTALDRMLVLKDARREAVDLVASLIGVVASESPIMRKCRSDSPKEVITSKLAALMEDFVETAMAYCEITGESIPESILAEKDQIVAHVAGALTEYTRPLGNPPEVDKLVKLFESVGIVLRPDVDDALRAVELIDQCMVALGKQTSQLTAEVTALVSQHTKLQMAKDEKPPFALPMSMEELTAKAHELDAINRQMQRAGEWPAFEARQKDTAKKIADLNARIETLQSQSESVRQIRAEILQSSIEPVEKEANALLVEMGCPPLKIKVESKGRFATLTIENSQGIDLSVMCGAERVLYANALLCAIHQVSKVECPVRLIEAAELNAPTLTAFLKCLVKLGYRGNTFVATHVRPADGLDGVTVIEC